MVVLIAGVLFLSAPQAVLSLLTNDPAAAASSELGADDDAVRAFGGFLMTWAVTVPLTWGFVWLAVRRYPGPVPLLTWNAERPVWSAAWTVFTGSAAGVFLAMVVWWEPWNQVLFNLHMLADAWFLLVLRAAVVAPRSAKS